MRLGRYRKTMLKSASAVWYKVKNQAYTQMGELFHPRRR